MRLIVHWLARLDQHHAARSRYQHVLFRDPFTIAGFRESIAEEARLGRSGRRALLSHCGERQPRGHPHTQQQTTCAQQHAIYLLDGKRGPLSQTHPLGQSNLRVGVGRRERSALLSAKLR